MYERFFHTGAPHGLAEIRGTPSIDRFAKQQLPCLFKDDRAGEMAHMARHFTVLMLPSLQVSKMQAGPGEAPRRGRRATSPVPAAWTCPPPRLMGTGPLLSTAGCVTGSVQ